MRHRIKYKLSLFVAYGLKDSNFTASVTGSTRKEKPGFTKRREEDSKL
jgi:hypothetical protein